MRDKLSKDSEGQSNNRSGEEVDRKGRGYLSDVPRGAATGHVILPFNEEQFKEFIQGLLGRPQSITKTLDGSFEVTLDDIHNIYSTIEQRMAQQNNAWLLQFSARIVFSDDSTVLLNSLDLLLTYRETRPIVSKAIHLTWDYMVHFRDKEIPEKQQITVSIVSSYEISSKFRFAKTMAGLLPFVLRRRSENGIDTGTGGYLNFEIKHTARTWGADIEALLSNHFNGLLKREPKLKQLVRQHAPLAGYIGSFLFYGPLNVGLFYFLLNDQRVRIDRAEQLISPGVNSLSIDQKLNYIVEVGVLGSLIETRNSSAAVFIAMCSFFIFFFLAAFITAQATSWQPSFLLLTRESEKDKVTVLARLDRKWVAFIWSLIVSVSCGLLTNVLWHRYFVQ